MPGVRRPSGKCPRPSDAAPAADPQCDARLDGSRRYDAKQPGLECTEVTPDAGASYWCCRDPHCAICLQGTADAPESGRMLRTTCSDQGFMHHGCAAAWFGTGPGANCPMCRAQHAHPKGLVLPAPDMYPATDAVMDRWQQLHDRTPERAVRTWRDHRVAMLERAIAADDGPASTRLGQLSNGIEQRLLRPAALRAAINAGAMNAAYQLFLYTDVTLQRLAALVNGGRPGDHPALARMVIEAADLEHDPVNILAALDTIDSDQIRRALATHLNTRIQDPADRELLRQMAVARWPADVPKFP